ncbi:long-chain-fatty-acid--CoA ligase [Paracoccus tegillarcae]|uniref:Long-chain fatty acid--CoA ligase n=1 Tax=Paracoccus tegillarcae TaxID=1529068 RepID=A0A2K9EZJ3_9RHOB|nr:long-chain-fatty-acid--CoA ligase [Paracoccus tegillarcae]AUH32311.1 long-chain fatty acid--CoA ligase [Paracoccus tegillarcae]
MMGLMMHRPLLVSEILDYAAEVHPLASVVSRTVEGDLHRTDYPTLRKRAVQLSFALEKLGIRMGDRVATLAWNGFRHLELYYGISGIGAVCHTINPRLSAEQLIYIAGHAQDRLIFADLTFVPALEKLKDHLPSDLRYVIMTDRAHMPENSLDALCYEELLEGQDDDRQWPEFPEDTAASLCYTSGTTGEPKGALYTHRSNVLHSLQAGVSGFVVDMGEDARILPVVPLFHVNAWGLPYLAPMIGADLVFPGSALDGDSLYDLIESEGVTSAWGVPTIWQGLQDAIDKRGGKPPSLRQIVVGGSAAPRAMIERFEKMGIRVNHAWGMTEMSPIGSHGFLPWQIADAPFEERMARKAMQGRRAYGVDFKIVDDSGKRQPHDGKSKGELYVRGNNVVSGYFDNEAATEKAMDAEGWFGTGDVASIRPDGYLQLHDRAKDLIKSGGEWISSIDLENIAAAHTKVASAAVIAVSHPKWDERPLLVVVARDSDDLPTLEELRDLIGESMASWQLPDDLVFVEAMPLTATGKISKLTLRESLSDYVHPELRGEGNG